MKSIFLAGLTLLLCGPVPVAADDLAIPYELRIGESVQVEGTDLTLGFDAVLSDSRCPLLVMCVWEGEAEVSLWAESPGFAIEEFTLSTHPYRVQQATVFNCVVRLEALDPYPMHPNPIHPSLYVLTLTVEKLARVSADAVSIGMAKARY